MPESTVNRSSNTSLQRLGGDQRRVPSPISSRSSDSTQREKHRHAKKPAGTAFADLIDDMPGYQDQPEIGEEPAVLADIPTDSKVLAPDMRDRLNARVLTESGYQQTPYCWNSLLLGVCSLVLLYSWQASGRFEPLAPCVLGISTLGGLYSIRGFFKSSGGKARSLCALGVLLTLVAALGVL